MPGLGKSGTSRISVFRLSMRLQRGIVPRDVAERSQFGGFGRAQGEYLANVSSSFYEWLRFWGGGSLRTDKKFSGTPSCSVSRKKVFQDPCRLRETAGRADEVRGFRNRFGGRGMVLTIANRWAVKAWRAEDPGITVYAL